MRLRAVDVVGAAKHLAARVGVVHPLLLAAAFDAGSMVAIRLAVATDEIAVAGVAIAQNAALISAFSLIVLRERITRLQGLGFLAREHGLFGPREAGEEIVMVAEEVAW